MAKRAKSKTILSTHFSPSPAERAEMRAACTPPKGVVLVSVGDKLDVPAAIGFLSRQFRISEDAATEIFEAGFKDGNAEVIECTQEVAESKADLAAKSAAAQNISGLAFVAVSRAPGTGAALVLKKN